MRDTPDAVDFPSWLDTKLAERGWEVSDLARHAGISASIIHRWRKTYRPNVTNCRAIAKAFELPVLKVLTVAGILTSDETHANVALPPSVNTISTVDLTRELHRRAEQDQHAESTGHLDTAKMVEYMRKLVEEQDNVQRWLDKIAVEAHDGQHYRLVRTDEE